MDRAKHEKRVLSALNDDRGKKALSSIAVSTNIHYYKLKDIVASLIKEGLVTEQLDGRYLKYAITDKGLQQLE